MCLTFCLKAGKFSSEGTHLLAKPNGSYNFPLVGTLKCQPRKSNPSIAATNLVLLTLMLSPLIARNSFTLVSTLVASDSGLRMYTRSSADRTDLCMFSIPSSAILASNGLITPPWGVPCFGNSGLMPDFQHLHNPDLIYCGAITRFISSLWLILSKHFSMSSSKILFIVPLPWEFRFWNQNF